MGRAGREVSPAEILIERLKKAGKTLVLAESCTAGLAADALASVPGASEVFWGSFVCYTPEAKGRMLGVDEALIARYGAVSRDCACAMAEGAREKSGASLAAAVTGLAGPGGDGGGAPVGTVWIAVAGDRVEAVCFHYQGSRNEIRARAAADTLGELLRRLQGIDIKG